MCSSSDLEPPNQIQMFGGDKITITPSSSCHAVLSQAAYAQGNTEILSIVQNEKKKLVKKTFINHFTIMCSYMYNGKSLVKKQFYSEIASKFHK